MGRVRVDPRAMAGHAKEIHVQQSHQTRSRDLATADAPYRLKNGLGYKLSRAAKVLQSAAEGALRPFGLTRLSWTVLATVGFEGINAPVAIARYIGIERTAVSRILRQLEADGLIERTADETDGRAFCIGLTAAGAEICAKVPGQFAEVMAPLYARLDPAQATALAAMLDMISDTDDPVWNSECG